MPISTKISDTFCSERVQVPDEDAAVIHISSLFTRILIYNLLKLFVPLQSDCNAPIRAEIGSSQSGSVL